VRKGFAEPDHPDNLFDMNASPLLRKYFALLAAGSLAALPAHAQIITSEGLGGALIGAVAGGILGNNIGNSNTWEGAAIGAGAGLILGNVVREVRHQGGAQTQVPVPYQHYRQPIPGTQYSPSNATRGALLGGIAGGIIGNNTGDRNLWRGVAIGTGGGYLLGSAIDASQRQALQRQRVGSQGYRMEPWERPYLQHGPAALPPSFQNASLFGPGGSLPATTGNVTIINNYNLSGSQMAPANALFGR
jgi:uncharacterized protein YcfJ